MKIFRRIVFFLFLGIFLIGAPRLVFYALGYTYHPGRDQGLVKTGVIYISSTPPGATVFIGGSPYREPTPAMIRDLLPAVYPVRVELKNHFTWTRDILIEEGKAAVFGKVLLRPKKPVWHTASAQSFRAMEASRDSRFIILQQEARPHEWFVYNQISKEVLSLAEWNFPTEFEIKKVYTVSGSTWAVAEGVREKQAAFFEFDLNNKKTKSIDLGAYFKDIPAPENILWDPEDEQRLFVLRQNKLNKIDLRKADVTLSFADEVYGYAVYGKHVLLIKRDGRLIRLNFNGEDQKLDANLMKMEPALFGKNEKYSVFRLSGDKLLFLSERGRLLCDYFPHLIAESDVLGFDFDKKNQKVVFWTKRELGIAEFDRNRPESGDRPRVTQKWLFRGGQDIRTAYWAHEGGYVLFQDRNKLFLADAESESVVPNEEVLETRGGRAVYFDATGDLTYLDRNRGWLMSVEIVPKWKVLEIPFFLQQEKEKIRKDIKHEL